METIVFIGAGSMAEAIIAGIVEQGALKPEQVFVTNHSDYARLEELRTKYGVSILDKEKEALTRADLVVMATKPKDIHQAMTETAPYLKKEAAVLSVIAGVSIQTLEDGFGARPIARSMPNTSATIGKSASGVAWNAAVDSEMKQHVLTLLESIGIVKEFEEDDLHTVTALSGSGPAYVYYLVEAMEEAAINKGLSKDVARELIIQTLEGAAAMLKQTKTEPAELRKNITSPGGTTEAGLKALEIRLFKQAIGDCINQAESRSRELGALS
ncbi:pyrroline-5-carboxylate reductase [Sporosarcina sp. 179-K 3D1 HS]|uniref:pyrroline-5-carboxylate reductase n=1 Tax=Sporosarcina sp. 179-K 3D1 HS TaxID=3232169 RepID=UPI0039A016D1